MNKNIEKRFNEAFNNLQQEVLDLHRKAGILDSILEQIGIEGAMNNDPKYLEAYVQAQRHYYDGTIRARGYNTLERQDTQYWNDLCNSCKGEES